ncbi:hypothetical protein EUX98_g9067 [Antrodiella citrinella]|uniref:Protein kinase domain-containing protein n=1 Tax=Antrodiella citrinella TaxID=2447956 RepID=A0A4S4M4E8_9APHY|nr:hypothetical protein EUX98_g9067 [Antrodiella citrinella]
MSSTFKFLVFYLATDLSGQSAEDLAASHGEEALEVIIQHRSLVKLPQDESIRVLEEKVYARPEGPNPSDLAELPMHIKAEVTRDGVKRNVHAIASGYPWSVSLQSVPEVSYWNLIRGREGQIFIRPGKHLDELILSSKQSEADKNLLLASRNELATYILERLQNILDGTAEKASVDANYRYGIRRLLVRLCVDSGILPPSLFLTSVKCTDTEPVGMGGYADIFCGTHAGGRVALKRLRTFLSVSNQQNNVAFYKEALVWRHLRHPSILPFLGIDQITFKSYLSMVLPWMQFGDINNCMNVLEDTGELMPYLGWVTEIAEGMAYLHSEHVVHADLRGANVLIDESLHVKLSDFGLSQFADSTTASKGSHGGGTLRWMAPELLIGDGQANYASDVWAFGCVCLEVYTRSRPFPSMNDAQVIVQIMRGDKPPRKAMKTGEPIPEEIWHIIEGCWSSQVKSRPSMAELVMSLQLLSKESNETVDEATEGQVSRDALPYDPSDTHDSEIVSLIESTFSSKLYKGLVLAARGDLADQIMCTMLETLDKYSSRPPSSRPKYFNFLRCLLLRLSSNARILPSSLAINGVRNRDLSGSTGISDIYTATYQGKQVALKRLRNSQSAHERSLFDIMDIAQALEYLHNERIVHADIRSGNIFIDEDMHAKLAHFNVSFFEDEHQYDNFASDRQYGSEYVRWMAPELLSGDTQPTFSTDVYAFGCLCVEMFIGEEIYISLDWEMISRILAQDKLPPRPTGKSEGSMAMADDLWALVQSCWTEPETRLTMLEVVAELSRMRPSQ